MAARSVSLLWLPLAAVTAAAATVDVAAYDEQLCETAQRVLVNAAGPPAASFAVRVLRGEGNGFHTIQMDVDERARAVVVAASVGRSGGLSTHVACKMVDRERINDQLRLGLAGPERSCRDVNEFTYAAALGSLTASQRQRYEAAGRPLRFAADYLAATGGEWLPVAVDDFIRPLPAGGLEVRAPSVRVPWNPRERNFFQGTRHCKLITMAAMRRWMIEAAPAGEARLFPSGKAACAAPSAPTSAVGSCVFYFAPAGMRFCEDYSGAGWTEPAARAACGKRHASAEALRAAANRYEGAGGDFSTRGCIARDDSGSLGGTCVFHCNAPDETLWRSVDAPPAAGGMMTRACDLYMP